MPRSGAAARARLQKVALELFTVQGFEQTTTAQIAVRAGLNERTFFRHFPNKGEVLFDGEEELRDALAQAVVAAPADSSPLDALQSAFVHSSHIPASRREFAEPRWRIISSNSALRDRDAAKALTMSHALADALVARGVAEPVAALASQAGWAAFHQAMERWILTGADLDACISDSMDNLRALTVRPQCTLWP